MTDAPKTIYSLISEKSNKQPESVAIKGIQGNPLTYKDLKEQLDYTQNLFQKNGIQQNDCVAVILNNGPEMATTFLTTASTTKCAPLNPNYKHKEYKFYLTDLQPKALIIEKNTETPAIKIARELNIKIFYLKSNEDKAGAYTLEKSTPSENETYRNKDPSPNDTALILHTSGTTSRPKMVPLTNINLCTSAQNIAKTLKLTEKDRCLNVMPLFHIHGLIGALLSTIHAGATIICTPGYDNQEFNKWLREQEPTWYTAVPTIHHAVYQKARKQPDSMKNPKLRLIRSSSSAMPPQLMEELEETFNVPVIESYGMTEASHQMASNPLPPGKRKPGSVGLPMGPEIAIMDTDGNLMSQGVKGEIVIRGPSVTKGYLNNPEANAEAFTKGWFRTGDEGYFDEEGYLFLTDRIKEIINRGGEKVSPREIDEVILDHPDVKQALTFAVPHPTLGEEIGVAVVKEDDNVVTDWDIQKHVSRRLVDFKVPRHVVFLDEIPKGATGKLQRIGLAERLDVEPIDERLIAEESEYLAPSSDLERRLVEIWSDVLGHKVGVVDNYFNLGGDSLKAEEIVTRISKSLDIEQLPIVVFLQAPTIRKMVELLESEVPIEEPTLICMQEKGNKLPLYLIHACGGEVLFFSDLVHNMGKGRPIYALRAPTEKNGSFTYSSIEELASFYVDHVILKQEKGPYIIGGAALGGLIALEMALQIKNQNKKVSSLILFDTVPPIIKTEFRGPFALIKRYLNRIALHWKKGDLFSWVKYHLIWKYHNLILEKKAQTNPQLRLQLYLQKISSKYNPVHYDGEVLLFMSEKRKGPFQDPYHRISQWDKILIGERENHVIPGEHTNILKEPYLRNLAPILKQYLINKR
jgi:acyl-CoA synthetase (AMP-forming)/AMP-acid ligase II/thioesterase domain-containing protein